jgi:hypothetical protein
MTNVNMPGFTADASLFGRPCRYGAGWQQAISEGRGGPQLSVVVSQLGGPGFEGLGNCISDCSDTHPTWTAARCRAACHASEIGAGGGPSDPTSVALSIAGCWSWWAACKLNPLGFFCDTVRDKCLADIRR